MARLTGTGTYKRNKRNKGTDTINKIAILMDEQKEKRNKIEQLKEEIFKLEGEIDNLEIRINSLYRKLYEDQDIGYEDNEEW